MSVLKFLEVHLFDLLSIFECDVLNSIILALQFIKSLDDSSLSRHSVLLAPPFKHSIFLPIFIDHLIKQRLLGVVNLLLKFLSLHLDFDFNSVIGFILLKRDVANLLGDTFFQFRLLAVHKQRNAFFHRLLLLVKAMALVIQL